MTADAGKPDDLIAFLNARLDEDAAEAASWAGPPSLRARQRREVEADRKLLDLYERARSYRDKVFVQMERSISDEMRAVTQMMALEQVLKLRAAVYSDHPDYRAEWTPGSQGGPSVQITRRG